MMDLLYLILQLKIITQLHKKINLKNHGEIISNLIKIKKINQNLSNLFLIVQTLLLILKSFL
jgi:hypothetical protein